MLAKSPGTLVSPSHGDLQRLSPGSKRVNFREPHPIPSMKKSAIVLSIGALVSALFLSGCMAAMMPAMLLGHAAFRKMGGSHEHDSAGAKPVKPCECEKPGAEKADGHATEGGSQEHTAKPCDCDKPAAARTEPQVTPTSPGGEKPAVPPSSGHNH